MMFTVGNIPTISEDERTMKTSDAILQKVLVKTLLKVSCLPGLEKTNMIADCNEVQDVLFCHCIY